MLLPGNDLDWQWWTIHEIRDYIERGGLDDDELLSGLKDLDFGSEFLVLIIEYVGGPEKQEAYFHRMNKAELN